MKNKLLIPISLIIGIVIFWFSSTLISGNFFNYENNLIKGEKYFNEGKIQESIREFQKVIKSQPDNIKSRVFLAKAYFLLDETEKSIIEYKKILQMDKDNKDAILNIISIYAKKSNYIDLEKFMHSIKGNELINKYKPENPIPNKSTGLYSMPVSLKFENEINSKVLFTTDGKDPTYQSEVFSNKIVFEEGTHNIKAVTLKNGFMSDVTQVTLKIKIEVIDIEFENKKLEEAIKKTLGKTKSPITNQDIIKIKSVLIFGKNIEISLDDIKSVFATEERKEQEFVNSINVQVNDEIKRKDYNFVINENNALNLVDLKKFTDLEMLIISGIDNFDIDFISDITTLKELNISYCNEILNTHLLKKLVNIETLFLTHLNLEDVTFLSDLINIQQLDISNNKVKNISDIKNLQKLKKLNISNNNIMLIGSLVKLTNLVSLSFNSNNIENIEGIEQLNNLVYLSFVNNNISDISYIKNLVTLEYIYFNSNPVQEKKYAMELPYLKKEIKDEIRKNEYINE